MQTNSDLRTYFLVGVSNTLSTGGEIEAVLSAALSAVGASFDPLASRKLSGDTAPFAAELGFTFSDGMGARLALALSDFPGDWAVVPAQDRRKRLLICDMDSTIIAEECLDELADFAGLKAEISAITERAMAGELSFEEALTTRVSMLEGLPVSAIMECYTQRIHLNAGARTLVATMTAHGAVCQLVSGGFTDFTARVAAAAGFSSHHANTLENDGTALTGKVGLPILDREAKLEQLQRVAAAQGLGLYHALCMGDGANDLAMIEAAGLGIAYRAKPIVAERADAAINHTDLTTALFFQGYSLDEFVTG